MKIGVAVGVSLMVVIILVAGGAAAVAQAFGGSASLTSCITTGASVTIAGYGADQLTNASTIVAVGRQMSVPAQGWVVAITAAMQESALRNVDGGDRDSLGLFQERPSQGWGTRAEIMNPVYSSQQFYRRLVALPDWQEMSVNDAAQAVERSAFPDAYAPHEQAAMQVVDAVQGAACTAGGVSQHSGVETVVSAALSEVGVPYAWGGGTAAGPSLGSGPDADTIGFDCSGLALYAYAKIGVSVPHQTRAIWAAFQPAITDRSDIAPGDLILLSSNGHASGIHHVAIYLGPQDGGQVIEAPDSGGTVRVTSGIWTSAYWQQEFIGAVRPAEAG